MIFDWQPSRKDFSKHRQTFFAVLDKFFQAPPPTAEIFLRISILTLHAEIIDHVT
jgi:hypothetical protein